MNDFGKVEFPMKHLLTGNEAAARGAYEAGVRVCSAYPGTPSTEIFENLPLYKDALYCEWAPNEKVATEVAVGAAIGGVRALTAMKHVGLNVAADPIFTAVYNGVDEGLVVVSADDPSMHSSQNEQDNRYYAMAAKMPMVEPADSQECKDFMKLAYDISSEYHIPVLYRVTTRVCHSKSLVEFGERTERELVLLQSARSYALRGLGLRRRGRLLCALDRPLGQRVGAQKSCNDTEKHTRRALRGGRQYAPRGRTFPRLLSAHGRVLPRSHPRGKIRRSRLTLRQNSRERAESGQNSYAARRVLLEDGKARKGKRDHHRRPCRARSDGG